MYILCKQTVTFWRFPPTIFGTPRAFVCISKVDFRSQTRDRNRTVLYVLNSVYLTIIVKLLCMSLPDQSASVAWQYNMGSEKKPTVIITGKRGYYLGP